MFEENSMKPIERLTHHVSFRTGIIGLALMVILALALTSARRVELAVNAAVGRDVPAAAVAARAENGTSIRPFRIKVPEADLAELRQRIAATRWPEKETVADQSQGVPLGMIRELARYWGNGYDWRKAE